MSYHLDFILLGLLAAIPLFFAAGFVHRLLKDDSR